MPDRIANPNRKLPPSAERLIQQVEAKQQNMQRGRNHRDALLRSAAILGVIGWSVVVPTLTGVAVGIWIDGRWPGRFSWTITLMSLGLLLGCANAWIRIRSHQ